MSLRSALSSNSFEGRVRVMRDGKHVGNLGITAARDRDEYDLSVNSTAAGISVSNAITLNSAQLLALVDKLTAAVKSKGTVDVDTNPPKGAA